MKLKKYNVIFLLLLLCGMPVIMAWVMYFTSSTWLNKTTNHGKLITPPITLQHAGFSLLSSRPSAKRASRDPWLMIYLSTGDNDPAYKKNLYKMRQIRLALAEKSDRVVRIIATPPHFSTLHMKQFIKENYAGTESITVTYPLLKPLQENTLYIADPHGYLMMQYRSDAKPQDILKDMKHLVR